MQKIFLVSLLLLFLSYNSERQVNNYQVDTTPSLPIYVTASGQEKFTSRIFKNDTINIPGKLSGFGYEIYRNKALFIHQATIPAVTGNKGFSSAPKARKAAGLVIYKLEKNILPPAVSIAELDSIGALD